MSMVDHVPPTDALDALGIGLPSFVEGLPGGFFIYEASGKGRILFANSQMAAIYGCEDVAEFLEHVGGTFRGMVYHEDFLRVENAIWAQLSGTPDEQPAYRDHVTYRICRKDGSLRFMDEYGRLVPSERYGDVFFVFVTDISSVASSPSAPQRKARNLSASPDMDPLTGLPTMRYYHSHVREALARATAEGVRMADVYFDVDHFKTVNYRLGYEGGDEVLQRVGAILRESFPDDLCARFSDDHFVLVTKREGLEQRIEKVHARASHIISSMPLEIKAGVYELAADDVSIAFAHDRAKVACASIKGRFDRIYRFYDETLAINEELREYIVGHIEEAVEKGWIKNYYQPVVSVPQKLTCSLEALSRWVDPERGIMSPAQYVHVLEDARLIHLLDRAVIERACSDLRRSLMQLGRAIPISLNFSPSALALLDVPSLVDEMVKKYDLPKDLIHVEFTESSLTEDPDLLRLTIAELHKLGYEVWMDDFGSGYSSLNLLKDYDFDVLKIDMEFLRGMEGNKKSRTIVRSITNLAHSLGMDTLVEGVETEGQFQFLCEVGADRAQGFLFSAPVPYEAIVGDFLIRYPPARMK